MLKLHVICEVKVATSDDFALYFKRDNLKKYF